MARAFRQVDVFATVPYLGNPVAVVLDGEGLSDEQMLQIARWTNLSETTFLLPPSSPTADYRLRIFWPNGELPFAGHPTLGSCHAWLEAGNRPRREGEIVQECGVGELVIRSQDGRLAFAVPPLVREGPLEPELLEQVLGELRIDRGTLRDAAWVDNGPGWVALLLESAHAALAVEPGLVSRTVGVVGPHDSGNPAAYEVRGFFPKDGATTEDPVTGSLNASVAQWLIGTGRFEPPYVVSQGAAIGRDGRVHIERDAGGTIWIGGTATTCIAGEIDA